MAAPLQVRRDITEASHGPMDPQVSNRFNRLLLSLADVHGALIKLADRLAALRKAPQGSAQHLRLAHEALEVYAPIANRMGVWSIKAAMEDLAFKVLPSVVTFFPCSFDSFLQAPFGGVEQCVIILHGGQTVMQGKSAVLTARPCCGIQGRGRGELRAAELRGGQEMGMSVKEVCRTFPLGEGNPGFCVLSCNALMLAGLASCGTCGAAREAEGIPGQGHH